MDGYVTPPEKTYNYQIGDKPPNQKELYYLIKKKINAININNIYNINSNDNNDNN